MNMMKKIPFTLFQPVLKTISTDSSNVINRKKRRIVSLNCTSLIHFYGQTSQDSKKYSLCEAVNILKDRKYDSDKKTVIYVHGYKENLKSGSPRIIADAYMQRDDVNFLLLDWSELAAENYYHNSFINAKYLGKKFSKILMAMTAAGLNIANLHIVGNSLGGQLSGIVGREIYRCTNKQKKIFRITALDPAFPYFLLCKRKNHVNKDDAMFVDIIHTDALNYGSPCSTGTVDFWPNGGIFIQPGCPKKTLFNFDNFCAHNRSWKFWVESVIDKWPIKFDAVQASSWADFKAGRLVQNCKTRVLMGHNCPTNISGDFFLMTNANQPFAKGKRGITFKTNN